MAHQVTIRTISGVLPFHHFYAQMAYFGNPPWKWLQWISP